MLAGCARRKRLVCGRVRRLLVALLIGLLTRLLIRLLMKLGGKKGLGGNHAGQHSLSTERGARHPVQAGRSTAARLWCRRGPPLEQIHLFPHPLHHCVEELFDAGHEAQVWAGQQPQVAAPGLGGHWQHAAEAGF